MPSRFFKILAGLWTAVCLGFVVFAFVTTPAWDTEDSYYVPNGLHIFLWVLVLTFFGWLVGIVILFIIDAFVGAFRDRPAHRVVPGATRRRRPLGHGRLSH